MDILAGLFALLMGAAVCFAGLRVFLIMLPIWGFFAGFFVGAAGVDWLFGDGFLSTVTGWIVGAVVGIGFALASYLFWYLGVLIASASFGGLVGSALANAFSIDSEWVIFFFALAGAILFVILTIVIQLPIYLVIVNSAFLGAVAIIAGVLLVFNQIDAEELGFGATWAFIEESWFWILAWVVVAALGIGSQLQWINKIALPAEKWVRAEMPTTTTRPPVDSLV